MTSFLFAVVAWYGLDAAPVSAGPASFRWIGV